LTAEEATGEACQALGRVLREGVDIHRCLAAQALGHLPHHDSVNTLLEALLDEDEDVRTDAAGSLARLAPPEASEQLLKSLVGDPCMGVKLSAIDALVRMRQAEVVSWLRLMVKGRDDTINWDESEFYEGGWDDWVDLQLKAIEGLAELGVGEAVPDIVGAIDDEFGQDLTEHGFKALAKLGVPGIEALSRYLETGDERVRRRVATSLAGCASAAARPALERALADRSQEVRLAAARGLARRDPRDPCLAAPLADREPAVRAEMLRLVGRHWPDALGTALAGEAMAPKDAALEVLAETPDLLPADVVLAAARTALGAADGRAMACGARILARLSPEEGREELAQRIADQECPLEGRLGAIKALASIGDPSAVADLSDVLGDDERLVRLEAMTGLFALTTAQEVWPNAAARALLAALEGELVPAPEIESEGAEKSETEDGGEEEVVRAESADTSQRDESEAPEPACPQSTLQSILGDEAPALAEAAELGAPANLTQEDLDRLALAARITGKRVVPLTPDVAPHLDVRHFAARVLGGLARPEVASALAQVLSTSDTDLRSAAADSLARIGEHIDAFSNEVIEALHHALVDAERSVRLAAIRALATAESEATTKALQRQLRDADSIVRAEAVRALARRGAAGPEIRTLLGDADPGVRLAAAEAVAGSSGPGTDEADVNELLFEFAFAFEGYHRRAAARLLRNLGGAQDTGRFVAALEDRQRVRFWPIAIEALEELNRADLSATNGPAIRENQLEGAGRS
jgi:HEAT repeat protein